jgi:hypothetical protein
VDGAVRKGRSTLIESRLASDFCREFMPGYRVFLRCPVGPLYGGQLESGRNPAEKRVLGNWRYSCDAVGVGVEDIVLIEFAVRFGSDHVGKLLGYSYLLSITPEFESYHDRELRLLAVGSVFDPLAELMCGRFDIEMVRFCPLYAEEYLRKLELRKQRPSRALMASEARYEVPFHRGYVS